MGLFTWFPSITVLVLLAIGGGILYLIFIWVNKFIALWQEQNDLLREISKKIDRRE
jgi:hypothetical protein